MEKLAHCVLEGTELEPYHITVAADILLNPPIAARPVSKIADDEPPSGAQSSTTRDLTAARHDQAHSKPEASAD